jgi:nucleotide-binding universal stress UspA family protein
MYNPVLVPLDGSQFSQSVLPYAKQLAKGLDIPIVLFHAVDISWLRPGVGLNYDREGVYKTPEEQKDSN